MTNKIWAALAAAVCACGVALDGSATTSSYTLSPTRTSYEHLVRGGSSNVEPLANFYTVEVPDGYAAKVHITQVMDKSALVHCGSKSVTYLVNGVSKAVSSTNRFTTTGTVSLSVSASNPDISWTEMYVVGYYTIAGVQTPKYSHRYHYYETYYYDLAYVITAQYIRPVTVSFETNGGGALADRSCWSGDAYGTLPTPSRSGYKFKGWYSNASLTTPVYATSTVGDAGATLYAKWAEYVTVGFDTNGGGYVAPQTCVAGETYGSLPTPTRAGYRFLGWYSNAALTSAVKSTSAVGASATTLYAKWAELVTVEFEANGGEQVEDADYDVGSAYGTLPTPFRGNYSFQGWHTDAALTTRVYDTTVADRAVTKLYAKWIESQPSFTINANGTLTCASLNNCIYIEIPDGVREIGKSAFSNCTSLVSVKLPETVTNIDNYAFCDCKSLRRINIPDGVRGIFYHAFYNCPAAYDTTTIPGVQLIDGWAVGYTSALSGALDLTGVRGLASSAFNGCTKITSVYIPDLVFAGFYFFKDCTGLTTARFDNSMQTFEYGIFYGCTKLSDVVLPSELEEISDASFYGCTSLASINIPSCVTNVESSAFCDSGITQVSIPANVKRIKRCAFMRCPLSTVSIYSSDITIESNAFWHNSSPLRSIYLYCHKWPDAAYGAFPLSEQRQYTPSIWIYPSLKGQSVPSQWTYFGSRSYFSAISVSMSFDANGGREVDAMTYTEGNTYGSLPTPERTGYTFKGWRTKDGASITASSVVSRFETNLFAAWAANTYTLTLDAQGGGTTAASATATYAEDLPDVAAPWRFGYAFDGYWTETGDGGEQVYDRYGRGLRKWTALEDATLYAKWTAKEWDASDYLNDAMDLPFASGGDAEWTPDAATSHDGVASMRSGVIGAAVAEGGRTQSVLMATMQGAGAGSFWWKASCEEPYYDEYYDYAAFMVDGEEVARIAGDADWTQVRYEVTGEGEHVLSWHFTRDDFDEPDAAWENCAWVDELVWTPTPVTLTLDADGATEGEALATVTRYEGFAMVLPGEGAYEKTMCALVGWTDGERTYAVGETFAFGAADVTLRAVWRELSWTLAEAVDAPALTFTTGGDAEWAVDPYAFLTDMVSLRSGAITHSQESWLETTVGGPGELSFSWKVDGEVNRSRLYDYAKVTVDGETVASAGSVDWTRQTLTVSGAGRHTVRWTYLKNASVDVGEDCAWLDEVTWTPKEAEAVVVDAGGGKTVAVPAAWLAEHGFAAEGGAVAASATLPAANGRPAWECYMLGLDPANTDDDFRITSFTMENGVPRITYEPGGATLAPDGDAKIGPLSLSVKLKGKAELGDDWRDVPKDGDASFRFFTAEVEVR